MSKTKLCVCGADCAALKRLRQGAFKDGGIFHNSLSKWLNCVLVYVIRNSRSCIAVLSSKSTFFGVIYIYIPPHWHSLSIQLPPAYIMNDRHWREQCCVCVFVCFFSSVSMCCDEDYYCRLCHQFSNPLYVKWEFVSHGFRPLNDSFLKESPKG